MTDAPTSTPKKPSTWKLVLAGIFDFITAFVFFGFLVGWLTGGLTEGGFSLAGVPALVCFLLIIGYFIVFNKYLGGTIWRWILGARKVQS